MTDRNEALRLAEWLRQNSSGIYRPAADAAYLLDKQAERIADLEAERDKHKATFASLLSLLADIRMACGDNGLRMQPELVEFIGAMKAERDQLLAEVERTGNNRDMWKGQCERQAEELGQLRTEVERYRHLRNGQSWPAVFASHDAPEPLRGDELDTDIDHARTTHKDEG